MLETTCMNATKKELCLLVFVAVLAALGAFFASEYLRVDNAMLVRLLLAALGIGSVFLIRKATPLRKREIVGMAIFSALFDLSLVLGYHLIISDNTYSGTIADNYISPYSAADIAAFVFMLPLITVISLALYALLSGKLKYDRSDSAAVKDQKAGYAGIKPRVVVVFAVVLFVSWLPYLIVHYPGFVFGDTGNSLNQIFGNSPLRNHHPVMYTLFIGACLDIAHAFGLGNAAGCALYCVIQMSVMAAVFSYLTFWIVSRGRVSGKARYVVVALMFVYFGISPYIATYSIALWKDPLFSVALVMVTLLLADVVVLGGCGERGRFGSRQLIPFIAFALLLVFFRNNGVYVLVATAVCLAVWLLLQKGDSWSAARRQAKRYLAASLAVAALFFLVTGPVFKAFGVMRASNVETVGIPINQMARVAAAGGQMSDSDREFLDSILPIEQYPEKYRPCCVDMLKWDAEFDSSALGNDPVGHYLSLLTKNPVTFFEAWELQTFGFWTVNVPNVYEFDNIGGGVPKNDSQAIEAFGISSSAGIQNETVREFFPKEESSVTIGQIFWLLLYLGTCVVLGGETRWLVVLIPSLGLLGTLLIASPIWYWPRYAAAVQFLLPFYLFMMYHLRVYRTNVVGLAENRL